MQKDPTKIDFCAGMSWRRAKRWLASNAHMLALGKDEAGLSVARSFARSGAEPATAELAARLALKRNGVERFTAMATGIYADMAKELAGRDDLTAEGRKRVEDLRCAVTAMEQWTAMAACCRTPSFEFGWPIRMPKELWGDLNRRAGLANVMLWLAAEKLEDDSGSGLAAAAGILRFLRRGVAGARG